MALSMLAASPALYAPATPVARAAAPYMTASWYDAGTRLTGGAAAVAETAPAPEPAPAPVRRAEWNPQGLDVVGLPRLVADQFVTANLKTAPAYLDGSMPGDIGFDPWGLVALANPTKETDKFARSAGERNAAFKALSPEQQQKKLMWMRESEIKHARLAMIAVLGWAAAELSSYSGARAPSLFNGGLFDLATFPVFFLAAGGAAFFEYSNKDKTSTTPGDYGFDPLGLSSDKPLAGTPIPADVVAKIPNLGDKEALQLAEIKNGRAAMMAITGFAVQEFVWGNPVVQQTPIFFGR